MQIIHHYTQFIHVHVVDLIYKSHIVLHYQLQFHENSIKSSLKTHEPTFHGHENGDSPFHGLSRTHEFAIKFEAV